MRWINVIGLSAGVVGVLTAAGVAFCRPRIERDLVQRASEELKKRDVPVENLRFQGRDGTVVIEKSERLNAADVRKAAESVFGVRVAKVEEIVKSDPALLVERIGKHLRVSGRVSEKETIALIIESASKVFGPDNVQNALELNYLVRKAAYLSGLVGMLPIVERVGPEAKLQLEERNLVLAGLVPDMDTKEAVEREASQLVPSGLRFESRLVVPERSTTAFRTPDLIELLDAIRLNFEFDSTKLTHETSQNLDLLKQTLGEFKIGRVRILGHTDSIGSETYNLGLSRRRAKSIQRRLVGWGFATRRFETRGRGESEPVADNATVEGRQLNRRVAFGIAEGK